MNSPLQFRRASPKAARSRVSRRGRGFTLVEVTLALGICAFCLVVLFGLLPTGLNVIRKGVDETNALNRLGAVLADVKATPLLDTTGQPSTTTVRYGMDLTGTAGTSGAPPEFFLDELGNKLDPTASAAARFRVAYRIPAQTAGAAPKTRVYLRASWPGAVTADRAQGLVEISVTINRND